MVEEHQYPDHFAGRKNEPPVVARPEVDAQAGGGSPNGESLSRLDDANTHRLGYGFSATTLPFFQK